MRYRRGLFHVMILGVLFMLAGVSQEVARAGQWPGWRGLQSEGRSSAETCPIRWSSEENILWKASIPGEGYSSPVVSEDSVFVTTAYMGTGSATTRLAVNIVLLAGIAILAGFTIHLLIRSCASLRAGLSGARQVVGITVFAMAAALLAGLVLVSDEKSTFEKSSNARWLISIVFVVLCLILSASYARYQPKVWLLVGVVALLLAGYVMVASLTTGASDYWNVEPGGGKMRFLVAAMPALVGAFLLLRYVLHSLRTRFSKGRSDTDHQTVSPGGVWRWVLACGLLVVVATISAWAICQNKAHEGQPPYEPMLPWWLLAVVAAAFGSALALRAVLGSSYGANLWLQISAIALASVSLAVFGEQVAARSTYLSYQLATHGLKLTMGWLPLLGLGGICLLSFLVPAVARIRPRYDAAIRLPTVFRGVLLVLGISYFVSANYLLGRTEFLRAIVCLDRSSGDIRWIWEGLSESESRTHASNSSATPTPVTDGKRVYAYFGSAGLVCCNRDGGVLWINKELPHDTAYGVVSSPILCDDRIIIASESRPGDSKGHGYIAAVDCGTGYILFKRERSEVISGLNGIHRTPLLKDIGGKKVILVWGLRDLAAYDSVSGDELWHCGIKNLGGDDAPVVSLVADEKRLYLAGSRKAVALAVDRLGTDQDPTLWEKAIAGPNCSTPVLANGRLMMVSEGGKVVCLDAQRGDVLWQASLKGMYYPSPVVAGNRVYFCNNKGCTTVATYDRGFEAVAENDLRETTYASLAPVDGMLFVRTVGHVYCIKEKGPSR